MSCMCDKCYKKSVCKIIAGYAKSNIAGCIEYLPENAIKKYWLNKIAKIKASVGGK